MFDEEIHLAVASAIEATKHESPLLEFSRVHERAIAHRLAVHMDLFFLAWNVDCEYDRDGLAQKMLDEIKGCDAQKKSNSIIPDIVVHHRGVPGRNNNLLVVEIKKNDEEDTCDRKKLELLTDQSGYYQYQLGLYINVKDGEFVLTWYKEGRRQPR